MRLLISAIVVGWLGVTAIGVASVATFATVENGATRACLYLLEQITPAAAAGESR
jgi:hypothetical protein